jgi:hypothetical protein
MIIKAVVALATGVIAHSISLTAFGVGRGGGRIECVDTPRG